MQWTIWGPCPQEVNLDKTESSILPLSVSVSRSVVPDSLRPHGLQPTRLLCPWDFPGTGVGCHFLLQGIFPTQGSNPGILHCRQILYWLSYKGSPITVNISSNYNCSTRSMINDRVEERLSWKSGYGLMSRTWRRSIVFKTSSWGKGIAGSENEKTIDGGNSKFLLHPCQRHLISRVQMDSLSLCEYIYCYSSASVSLSEKLGK